jgi:hypothetical protein
MLITYLKYCIKYYFFNYFSILIKTFLYYLIGNIPIYENKKVITIKTFVYNKINNTYNTYNNTDFLIKKHNNLYENMKILHDIFKKNKIKYWATCGTLLGLIRNNSILPHDNDIDICIMEDQIDNILFLNQIQDNIKFTYSKNIIRCNLSKIDIFIMKQCYNMIIYKHTPINWINEYYYINEIEEIITLPFGNYEISCIKKYDNFLIRAFGKNYLTNICLKMDCMTKVNLNYNIFYNYLIRRFHRFGYYTGLLIYKNKI